MRLPSPVKARKATGRNATLFHPFVILRRSVLRLAETAFAGEFDRATLIHWLRSYCRRFFVQQFKRSASADGPAVMGFTLSPRDGHKMPSDASNALWLDAVEGLEQGR